MTHKKPNIRAKVAGSEKIMFAKFFSSFKIAAVMNQSRVCSAPFFACSHRFYVNTYVVLLNAVGERQAEQFVEFLVFLERLIGAFLKIQLRKTMEVKGF